MLVFHRSLEAFWGYFLKSDRPPSMPRTNSLGLLVRQWPTTPHINAAANTLSPAVPCSPMTNSSNPPACRRCQSNRSRSNLPCVCVSKPPPSSSTLPPSSMAVDSDEDTTLRRASLDSDSSMFSHFSLTPENEASLRAWEQEMLGQMMPTSTPASSKHSQGAGKSTSRRWVVFYGRIPGVYDTL